MVRTPVVLLIAAGAIVAATWGLCAPIFQTRCFVRLNGIHVGWANAAGFTSYYEIYPGSSIVTWGMIDWSEIETVRFHGGLLGAYLRIRYSSGGEQRTLDLGPFDKACESAARALLVKDPKYIAD